LRRGLLVLSTSRVRSILGKDAPVEEDAIRLLTSRLYQLAELTIIAFEETKLQSDADTKKVTK
jgi:hypothetical protein